MVIDDHALMRDVVRAACEREGDLEVVGDAADGRTGLELCRELRPDVVVLDLDMPQMIGLEVARQVKEENPATGILVLTASDDGQSLFDARRIGVDGYLHKNDSVDEIVRSIRAIGRGESTFRPGHERKIQQVLGGMVRQARESRDVADKFTPREIEVLRLISEGLTTRQVSGKLGVSERTVESHISKLYRKLEAKTRVQALATATRLGLLDR